MKKQFLLVALVALTTISFAQVNTSFGVRAGVTSSGMRGDAVNSLDNLLDFSNGMITTNNRTGFFAGAYANVPVSSVLSIEPGLFYTQKGMELTGAVSMKGVEFLGANAKARLNAQYIDMPVLLKANLSGFEVFAGPQISYLANANMRTTAGVLGFNLINYKVDANNQYNRWDAAVTGGIGYQFTNGINVRAAYDYGLTKADANRNLNTYNQAFKIGVGMSF